MTTWEEDFTSDDSEYHVDGDFVGKVSPLGGSWKVIYRGETVAVRPDKQSAQACLVTMCIENTKNRKRRSNYERAE